MATATERDALPRAIRHRFPLLEQQVYLNSCSQGVLSDAVRASYSDYLRDWDEQGAPWEYWMERTESARSSFAGLVGAHADEIAVNNRAQLVYVVNLGCVDLNPHAVRAEDMDRPDELRIDLDPVPGIGWSQIVEVAKVAREVLEEMGLVGWPKTSGSRGAHPGPTPA